VEAMLVGVLGKFPVMLKADTHRGSDGKSVTGIRRFLSIASGLNGVMPHFRKPVFIKATLSFSDKNTNQNLTKIK